MIPILYRHGSDGPGVAAIQRVLGVAADGDFGGKTLAALIAWQGAHGLTADGVVGPATWRAMGLEVQASPAGAARVARARTAIGTVTYKLGTGGYDPTASKPGRATCDCSGFIAWVHGMSRRPSSRWPWWFSTDSVWRDIHGPSVLFDRVDPADVQPGDVVVYPDKAGSQGHIALVTDPVRQIVVECGIRGSVRRAHPDWPALGERERADMFANPRREFGRWKG